MKAGKTALHNKNRSVNSKRISTIKPSSYGVSLKSILAKDSGFEMSSTIVFARNGLNGKKSAYLHNYVFTFHRTTDSEFNGKFISLSFINQFI